MRVAVLTLTRDRLAFTHHCFATLRENAGCDFDHYVLDQGSTDGTREWLLEQDDLDLTLLDENIGVCAGLNALLRRACDPAEYDVVVRFDNDCEVTQPDTLRVIAELAHDYRAILAPRVLGLRQPPPTFSTFNLGGYTVAETHILGGIFMAIPAELFHEFGFEYDERNPLWSGDEEIVPWWRGRQGRCGYVTRFEVNHYQTTDGQAATFPAYFERRVLEGGPAL